MGGGGWSKVRTHGVVKESVRQGKLSSERAQSIEVSWIGAENERPSSIPRRVTTTPPSVFSARTGTSS